MNPKASNIMNPERSYFRISVHLDRFYDDHRSVCRIFVHTNKMKTIGALRKHLTNLFHIENFYMKSNNQYLPDPEDIRILDEGEIVQLIPIMGKNHYIKVASKEKVESESEVEVEAKEKKKKRKKKKLVDEPKTKKKKTDFDPVANSTIFSKTVPVINMAETPIKTVCMEAINEKPPEETPNTFKDKKQKKLITILSNDLVKKSGEASRNSTFTHSKPQGNIHTEVDIHTVPKNKKSLIGPIKDSETDFITPANSISEQKDLNVTKRKPKQDTIGYQSYVSSSFASKERINSFNRNSYEPPLSNIETVSPRNQVGRCSSVQNQPFKTPNNVRMAENKKVSLNLTNHKVVNENLGTPVECVQPIKKVLNRFSEGILKKNSQTPKNTLGNSIGSINGQELGDLPIHEEVCEANSIQESTNVSLGATRKLPSYLNQSRKSVSFEEKRKSIQPVTVLERKTNIVKTIIASKPVRNSSNGDENKHVEQEKDVEEKEVVVEEEVNNRQMEVQIGNQITMEVENETENHDIGNQITMEVENETENCETDLNVTGRICNLRNSFKVPTTDTKFNEGNGLNVEQPDTESNNSGTVMNPNIDDYSRFQNLSTIQNNSKVQNQSEIFETEETQASTTQNQIGLNELSTQIHESYNSSTISSNQTKDDTLQIINFDSNSTNSIRPSTIFNTPKSLNTSNSTTSSLKRINGIGTTMESLQSDSSGLDTSRDCIAKRRRVRTRKRKKTTKVLGNSPIVQIKNPFFPPNTQTQPSIHIKFQEADEIETIEINDSVVLIDESLAESEVDGHEAESMQDSKNFSLLPEEEISQLPLMGNVTPKENNVIAFKILKIGEDYSPVVSNSITANVKGFNEDTKEVSLCILDGINEFEDPLGKFSLEQEEDIADVELLRVLNWENVIEPRLMFE